MEFLPIVLVETAIAFALTWVATPWLAQYLKRWRITGRDVHKKDKPERAEMGGIAVLVGFYPATLLALFLAESSRERLSAAVLTIVVVSIIGLSDYLFKLRQSQKTFMLMVASLPLVWEFQQVNTILFPMLGTISFGYFYPIILIPLALTTASNFTNMLAGFNGLEVGAGAIALITVSLSAAILNRLDVLLVTVPMCAGLLAFLRYNWYPAQVFPGDVGTLLIGATVTTAAVMGRMEVICMVTLFPHAIDFTLKMLTRSPFSHRRIYGDTQILASGHLRPPSYPALTHALMLMNPLNEPQLVKKILTIEALYCAIAIIITIITKY